MEFSTKSKTLSSLENIVKSCKVLPQLCFKVSDLYNNRDNTNNIINRIFNMTLIVRSSSLDEDKKDETKAGEYLSLLNVQPKDAIEAMWKVSKSYKNNNPFNEIFLQPMEKNIKMNGVLFTIDPNTGGNYFVINYDESGYSDNITSGKKCSSKTLYIFKNDLVDDYCFSRLQIMAIELMRIFDNEYLDIEFAINELDELILFQVRPLNLKVDIASLHVQKTKLKQIEKFIDNEMKPKPFLHGNKTIFGIMPDWNPAEMIGVRPKTLAQTLYEKVITNNTWAVQRARYGYKNVGNLPLQVDFIGHPYIDTRRSFNSFIPNTLDDLVAEKLVNFYLTSLDKKPSKHDKIEFDILFTCYTFTTQEETKMLKDNGFSNHEIKAINVSLMELTNNIIKGRERYINIEYEKIEKLNERCKHIAESDLSFIEKVYYLIEDCKVYGSLPFAGLARTAFIAIEILESLVTNDILTSKDYEMYLSQMNTISSQMLNDMDFMTREEFLKNYGHLRPGTYDINSERYDQAFSNYFNVNMDIKKQKEIKTVYQFPIDVYEKTEFLLKKEGFECNAHELFEFFEAAIRGREYSKFIFTRNISLILEQIAMLGKENGISREDMAYVNIGLFEQMFTGACDISHCIKESIHIGKVKYEASLSLVLPPIISSSKDLYCFHIPSGEPNFITLGEIVGDICNIDANERELTDKIVLISSADPGYDWIFTHNIRGLVTAYGGINSHMAIRANELGIASVIGVGEKLYTNIKNSNRLQIDCCNKQIRIIS